MKKKIGIVTLFYNEQGEFLSAEFESHILAPEIEYSNSASILKDNADRVLASWFSKVTDIELNCTITSEALECKRWGNGNIKECNFIYYAEKQ